MSAQHKSFGDNACSTFFCPNGRKGSNIESGPGATAASTLIEGSSNPNAAKSSVRGDIRILLIEDNLGDAVLIREMLRDVSDASMSFGYSLLLSRVSCLQDALVEAAKSCPDIFLLDMSLPDAQGLEGVEGLRNLLPETPIVLITGHGGLELATQALSQGVQDYLIKGQIDGNLLSRSVVYAIERRRYEQERRELEAKFLQSQKLESLGVMAGGIAHDFNNLLMGVLSNATLALEQVEKETPLQEKLLRILNAGQRAAELVRQLLAYCGQGPLKCEDVALQSLVGEIEDLLGTVISSRVKLSYSTPKTPIYVRGDVTQFRQVLMNLVTNASDALEGKPGTISVSTSESALSGGYLANEVTGENLAAGAYGVLEISDSGKGIEPETLQKMFDPFFTTKATGRGLGLAAVQGIVRGHKGALQVESAPGMGSVFRVYLPLSVVKQKAAEKRDACESQATSNCGNTILVVDDEETVLDIVRDTLEGYGFLVLSARNGKEGLSIFEAQSGTISAVLLDMTMPYMRGEDVMLEMRNIRKDVPIILSSGYGERETLSHIAKNGFASFIQKPYLPKDLILRINEVLSCGNDAALRV